MYDRAGLADFLRHRREALLPGDVGLRTGGRRRTPGLRREEVAQRANMSCDYYTRLEQGRGSRPSRMIVTAIATALRCDDDGTRHLFHLAGLDPPARTGSRRVRAGLRALVDRLGDAPVCITTDLDDVVWQNPLADALRGTPLPTSAPLDNLIRRWFTDDRDRNRIPEQDWPAHSANYVGHLRVTSSRRAGNADVSALVTELDERSAEFRTLWDRHEASDCHLEQIRVLHPEVGLVHLTCQLLLVPDDELRVLAFLPTEGTDAAERIELLRVIGMERFEAVKAHPNREPTTRSTPT